MSDKEELIKGTPGQFREHLRNHYKKSGDKLLPSTIERYDQLLRDYIKVIKDGVPKQEIIDYINQKSKGINSPVLYAALKHFLEWQNIDVDEVDIERPQIRAKAATSTRFLQSKVLSKGEITRLFNEIQDELTKLACMLLYDTACRRDELCSIKFGDILFKRKQNPKDQEDLENGIHAEINIIGKGHKSRTVFLHEPVVKMIKKMHYEDPWKPEDYLIVYTLDNGEPLKHQDHKLYLEVRKWTEEILGRKLHPHCFRHTKATHMADLGADILDIAAYLGHSDVASTKIYVEISTFRAKRAFHLYSRPL